MAIAWFSNSNNRANISEVPVILKSIYNSIASLSTASNDSGSAVQLAEYTPAVSIRKSLADPDYIISLIDGKPYKALRRHLKTNGLTPDEYRTRYGLKADYPMVSESYSEVRRAMAKKIGLGRHISQRSTPAAELAPATPPAKPGRKPKSVTSDQTDN